MNPDPSAMARCAMLICFGVDGILIFGARHWVCSHFTTSAALFSLGWLVVTVIISYLTERFYSLGLIAAANAGNIVAMATGTLSAGACAVGCFVARTC